MVIYPCMGEYDARPVMLEGGVVLAPSEAGIRHADNLAPDLHPLTSLRIHDIWDSVDFRWN